MNQKLIFELGNKKLLSIWEINSLFPQPALTGCEQNTEAKSLFRLKHHQQLTNLNYQNRAIMTVYKLETNQKNSN